MDAGNDQVQTAVVLMRLLGLEKMIEKKKMYLKEKILCRDTLAHIDVLENILHSLGSGVVQSLLRDKKKLNLDIRMECSFHSTTPCTPQGCRPCWHPRQRRARHQAQQQQRQPGPTNETEHKENTF